MTEEECSGVMCVMVWLGRRSEILMGWGEDRDVCARGEEFGYVCVKKKVNGWVCLGWICLLFV